MLKQFGEISGRLVLRYLFYLGFNREKAAIVSRGRKLLEASKWLPHCIIWTFNSAKKKKGGHLEEGDCAIFFKNTLQNDEDSILSLIHI